MNPAILDDLPANSGESDQRRFKRAHAKGGRTHTRAIKGIDGDVRLTAPCGWWLKTCCNWPHKQRFNGKGNTMSELMLTPVFSVSNNALSAVRCVCWRNINAILAIFSFLWRHKNLAATASGTTEREMFVVLYLDNQNRLLEHERYFSVRLTVQKYIPVRLWNLATAQCRSSNPCA